MIGFLFRQRPAISAAGEVLDDPPRALRRLFPAHEDALPAFGRRGSGLERPHNIDVIDEQHPPPVQIDVVPRILNIGKFREGRAEEVLSRLHLDPRDGFAVRVLIIDVAFDDIGEDLRAVESHHHLHGRICLAVLFGQLQLFGFGEIPFAAELLLPRARRIPRAIISHAHAKLVFRVGGETEAPINCAAIRVRQSIGSGIIL